MGLNSHKQLLVIASMLMCINVSAQITSTFNANAEGWTAPSANPAITYSATGGNPGGLVSGIPFSINLGAGTFYFPFNFVAPSAYRGNRSAYYNGTLQYDIQLSSTAGVSNQYAEVSIGNSLVDTLYYFPTVSTTPTTAWTTYSVVFNNTLGFWKTSNSPTGTIATEALIQSVLANLTGLEIRGLYRNSTTVVNRLDNVSFRPPIVVNTQPASSTICNGVTTILTTAASGNPTITYQWQFESSPSVWTNVTNTGGYSGATTTSLTVNTSGNFGAGNYRCRISGLQVDDAITSTATITINPLPAAPTATGNSSCTAASLALTAAGGAAGQYRWYTVPTGGTAIAGQTNSTYNTPVLAITTTYYTAINNGICESTRTAVIATINTPPPAPITTGSSSCTAASLTLTAAGGTAGQYRWYTVPTGGTAIAGQTNSNYTTPLLSATTTYYVAINNGTCESTRTPVVANIAEPGCGNTPPVIQSVPITTQINGKITLNLAALIADSDNNIDLSSLVIVSPPSSGASASIDNNFNLIIDYTGISFSGTENITIRVCDVFSACVDQTFSIDVIGDIEIFTGMSPNNDRKNDIFLIQYIELLPETQKNKVTIFNRWGSKVFEVSNYNNTTNVFNGLSENGSELPSGTYFYKIEFESGRKSETGYLTLKR